VGTPPKSRPNKTAQKRKRKIRAWISKGFWFGLGMGCGYLFKLIF
jgi:hypothetical protein